MSQNAFVLKIQRELCHPKSFGTFEKRAPGVRNSRESTVSESAIDVIVGRNMIGNLYNKGSERATSMRNGKKKNNTYAKENPSHKLKKKLY